MTVSDPVRITDSEIIPVYLTNPDSSTPTTPLITDDITGALATIDVVHHEVHEGEMFHAEHSASVGNGNNLDVLLATGAANEAHLSAAVAAGGQSLVYLYEAPNASGGTPLTVYNMHRSDTTHSSPFTAAHTPVVVGVGTVPLINGRLIAGGTSVPSRVGGETRANTEWILKPNTAYLLRVTNNSGASIVIHITAEAYAA